MRPHLILIHPPTLLDPCTVKPRHTLASATVASSALFEYHPLGFLTLSEYLGRFGIDTRIINLAAKITKNPRMDVRRMVRGLRPLAFGIDIHWLVHADGAMELARICKEEHPEIPVIMGGFSASYFHEEVIQSPHVDYILRGDSTEQPLLELMRALESKQEPSAVANLTWKRDGEVVVNPLTYQPELLDIKIDYRRVVKHALRYRDLRGSLLTGHQWPAYAFNMILFCRGCVMNCLTCGGSNRALGREKLAVRDPEVVAAELVANQQLSPFPVAFPGDPRQHQPDAFIEALRRRKPTRALSFELFWPAGKDFLEKILSIGPPVEFHFSPESHDEQLRRRFGRHFSNEELEQDLELMLSMGAKAFMFFVIGIPGQTRESVWETVDYAGGLLKRFNERYPGKLDGYISPLVPFIDPGSPAFEHPEENGYRLFARTLAEHRALMRNPDLRDVLNYETITMSRAEIIDIGVEAMSRMLDIREQCGLLKGKWLERDRAKVREAQRPAEG
jgi:B12-binding domain/radical SAM domain protein